MKQASIQRIFDVMQHSSLLDYIGEPVSELEHGLQAAARAVKCDASDELVLAALLHDVGHFCGNGSSAEMAGYGVLKHEEVGAQFLLSLGFSQTVAELVSGHVQAKRYLVSQNPNYLSGISEASLKTLEFQGGSMTEAEAGAFQQDPLFEDKLRLRKWDELAKDLDVQVPALESYRTMITRHLSRSAVQEPAAASSFPHSR